MMLAVVLQAEMIQVWLDVPGGVGSVVPLIREGAKNWMSSKQLRSLLLPDIIYSTFQNRVSQGIKPARNECNGARIWS